jgi:hypothetical protein
MAPVVEHDVKPASALKYVALMRGTLHCQPCYSTVEHKRNGEKKKKKKKKKKKRHLQSFLLDRTVPFSRAVTSFPASQISKGRLHAVVTFQ